eukprot:UC1_evm1s1568
MRFNRRPVDGVRYWMQTGCVSARDSDMLATVLLRVPGVSRARLGEYLSIAACYDNTGIDHGGTGGGGGGGGGSDGSIDSDMLLAGEDVPTMEEAELAAKVLEAYQEQCGVATAKH